MPGGAGLAGLAGLAWLESLGPQVIRPGLSRTRSLLASLAGPERAFRSLLVGGTNGKGSTAAFAASILKGAGVRTGLYTSPHLVDLTERIRVDEEDVSPEALDDVLSLVAAVSGKGALSPTYFEAVTVAAFELFRRKRVEVAVVEVGIGGRLDATNVLEPEVSAVTNVGADHLETLGPSLAEVAREKAGIFRRGRPALTTASGETQGVLLAEARGAGARAVVVPPAPRSLLGVSPLAGEHQLLNIGLAVAAAGAFVPLDETAILRGVSSVRWPGRLQRIRRPGRSDVVLDGAHNPDGAAALARWIASEGLAGKIDLVFGALGDKDVAGTFGPLAPLARRVVFVSPPSPRAAPPEAIAERAGRAGGETAASAAEALARLDLDVGREAGVPVIVCGSLYLVGEALRILRT